MESPGHQQRPHQPLHRDAVITEVPSLYFHQQNQDGENDTCLHRAQEKLKSSLKSRFELIFEGIAKPGAHTHLSRVYTELYITEGDCEGVNNEHEVWQIETASRTQTTQDTAISCNDIFKPLPGQERPIRTVLTKGIAGIGKTVSVQKFILDWAEGKANQDVGFIFVLPFRELNLIKDDQRSLLELLKLFHPETREIETTEFDSHKVLFIFDGLDESRLPFNFQHSEILSDVTKTSTVDELLTNLIKGNLLPSALLWITTRPAAANQIPPECVHRVTEIRGFNDLQKEEYLMKRFRDENLASRIISHIKSSKSLYIMCHMPLFCWISATVLEKLLGGAESEEIPKTLTEMYTHFLLIQTNIKNQKYQEKIETDPQKHMESDKDIILKIGQLAFQHLEKGNVMFYEDDLRECGIDVTEASMYSGMCTEIFKEESVLYQRKVYCFVHLSIQEFLAALYVLHAFTTKNYDALIFFSLPKKPSLHDLHKKAVKEAMESKNGHLDLFLRFLFGLSLDSSQEKLQGLLTQRGKNSNNIKKTVMYIQNYNRKYVSPERSINLFHCLAELKSDSLVKSVQKYLNSESPSDEKISPAHCSALAYLLLMSEEVLDELNLKKYNTTCEGRWRLMPAVKLCRKALLSGCVLTQKSYEIVASALQSVTSVLIELDLSNNSLGDSEVELLCAGLKSPNCKLQTLKLSDCHVTEKNCVSLASALRLNPSHLRELDLSYNQAGDSGVRVLSAVLEDPSCKLEKLKLSGCNLTQTSCEILVSALQSATSVLIALDLSNNDLGDSGVELLCAALKSQNSKLQTLHLNNNNLGNSEVELLCAGLKSPNCNLQTLDLSNNNLGNSEVELLCAGLKSLNCNLQTLNLSTNNLGDSGVELLCAGLRNPHCQLQTLMLSGCEVTERGCASLASALRSNPSHLRELDLSYNHPGDSGVRALSAVLEDPSYKLEKLNVDHEGETVFIAEMRKYACQLTLDLNTAHRRLSLSEGGRRVTHKWGKEEPYPDHPDRFDPQTQVLCREGLSARCYWEVEWSKWVEIGVAYKGISRKGWGSDCSLGDTDKSWCLSCGHSRYGVYHNGRYTHLPCSRHHHLSGRVGVYLDWPAGTLSFYNVSSDTLTLLHTFHTTFTEPLYPGFNLWNCGSSVSLCML